MESGRMLLRCAAASLLIAGCGPSRIAEREGETAINDAFRRTIRTLLADSLFPPATAGLEIVHAASGTPLYSLNARALFTPGSTMKILTAFGATARLGPEFPFTTRAAIDTGGNTIVVRGAGDPLFSLNDLDTLALTLASALPPREGWTLLGDTGAFVDGPWGKGWMWDDEPDPTAPYVSALSVGGNTVRVVVRPRPDGVPLVSLDPPSAYHRIALRTGVGAAGDSSGPLRITRSRDGDGREILITGTPGRSDAPVAERVSVREPAAFFLTLLAERLTRLGARVDSTVLSAGIPESGSLVAARTHTLDSVLHHMMLRSDNLAAECVVRTLGGGSAGQGVQVIRGDLGARGVDTSDIVQADGSGASRYNLISPAALVQILRAVARDAEMESLFMSSLPVAGRSGTLASRMTGTPAEGNIRAKTGTLTGVTALAGFATTADGERLAFAVMTQGIPGTVGPYRGFQDSLCSLLARLRVRELLP